MAVPLRIRRTSGERYKAVRALGLLSLALLTWLGGGITSAQGTQFAFGDDHLASEWPPGILPHSTLCSGQRCIAVRGDTVFVVWTQNTQIFLGRSIDRGTSFGEPVRIDDSGWAYRPGIALGPQGQVYVVWVDCRAGDWQYDIYFDRSLDGGSSFGVDIQVDDAGGPDIRQLSPCLAVDQNTGNVYVAWRDERDPSYDQLIYFAKSIDDGASFLPNIPIGPYGGPVQFNDTPSLAVGSDGTVYVAWTWFEGVTVAGRSLDEGETFAGFRSASSWGCTCPSLAISPDGVIYVSSSYGSPPCYGIVVSASVDGGMSFGPQVSLQEYSEHWGLSSVAASSHLAYVVWDDPTSGQIHFSVSADQGASFSEPCVVNDVISWTPVYASVTCDAENTVYIAWTDERHSSLGDIYVDVGCPSTAVFAGHDDTEVSVTPLLGLDVCPVPTEGGVTLFLNIPPGLNTPIELSVFSASGRLVRRLGAEVLSPRARHVVWDGLDDTGSYLSQGMYYVRLKAGSYQSTKRVVIVR